MKIETTYKLVYYGYRAVAVGGFVGAGFILERYFKVSYWTALGLLLCLHVSVWAPIFADRLKDMHDRGKG